MAEVKWQARRVSDGVLVDVTGDTEGTPAGAPTPNALEGGSGVQTVSLLGPYAVVFNSSGIGTSAGTVLTTAVPSGAVILTAWVEVTVEWNFAETVSAEITIAPNSDPGNRNVVTQYTVSSSPFDWAVQGDATQGIEANHADGSTAPIRTRLIRTLEAGRLAFRTTPATASTGAANIFAVIAQPA